MSNLPVLWVPPVTPPDPNERPPKRRRNLGVLAAAVAIVALPLFAYTVFGESAPKTPKPAEVVEAETEKAPAVVVPTPAAKPVPAASLGPSPETSGGNQPYIAGLPSKAPGAAVEPAAKSTPAAEPTATPAVAATPAPAPVETAAPALGPDGRPVRVIGIDRPSPDMAARPAEAPVVEAAPQETKPATAEALKSIAADPAARAAKPIAAGAADPVSKPAAAVAAPIGATEPRGAVEPAPAKPPLVEASRPTVETVKPVAPATESPSIVVQSGSGSSGSASSAVVVPPPTAPATDVAQPKSTDAAGPTPTDAAKAEPKAAEAKPQKTPLPPKRETVKVVRGGDPVRTEEADAFADRLGAIRRSEERRVVRRPVEEPPVVEDDEEVVVTPRRGWGFLPPFFGDGPRRPVLRAYEAPPPREAMGRERAPYGENCHYHAWPTEDMAFHRTVKCHWHRDPDDPSIRYVR